MSIKQKALNALSWSFIDSFASQGIQFIVGIVLARLLTPKEFDLIGIIVVFTDISETFIDSGFRRILLPRGFGSPVVKWVNENAVSDHNPWCKIWEEDIFLKEHIAIDGPKAFLKGSFSKTYGLSAVFLRPPFFVEWKGFIK